jgi:HSP20 family protein
MRATENKKWEKKIMANITRYNPFSEVVPLREAMNRLFEDSVISQGTWGQRGLAANLYETSEGFVLQVPMPGVNPESVEITAKQDTLSLAWKTSVPAPEGATARWQGFTNGEYQQSLTLPTAINAEKVEAEYENGILTLRLPKAEHAKARTIKVNAKR